MILRFNHIVTGLLLSLYFSVGAQCISGPYPFQAGERFTYEVAYNWGVIWVDAGKVIFKVDTVEERGEKAFYFDSYGESYRFYDWIYKVRDRFQSVVSVKAFEPIWFVRDTYEGGYAVDNRYNYDWEQGRVVSRTENSNKALTVDTLTIEACTMDVLTAIYYARTFEFENYKPGQKIPIHTIIDGAFYELYIRYLGREIKRNRDGKDYDCIKFSVMLVEGTIFAGGEDMVVWVTADENKVPIMVEARILIGSVKAYLTGYENTLTAIKVVE